MLPNSVTKNTSWQLCSGGLQRTARVRLLECVGVCTEMNCVTCPYHNAVQAWHEEKKENDISNDLLPCGAPAHAHTTFGCGTYRHTVRHSLRHAAKANAAATPPRHAASHTATPEPFTIYHAGSLR